MSLTKASYSMINGAPTNVLDYGVVANGSTDDTTATQNALANQTVQLANGTSILSSTLTTGQGQIIYGNPQTKYSTAAINPSILKSSAATAITISGSTNELKQFEILAATSGVSGSVGILNNDKYFLTCEDLVISGYETAVSNTKSLYQTYARVDAYGTKNGMVFNGTSGTWNVDWFNNVITLEQVRTIGCSQYGLDIQASAFKAINCDFSSCGVNPVIVRSGSWDVSFDNCYIENVSAGVDMFNIQGGVVKINGGTFQGNSSGSAAGSLVNASNGATVILDGCVGQSYFQNLIKASGGATVYIQPGTFSQAGGSAQVSTTSARYSTSTGGTVIDLSNGYYQTTKSISASGGTFTQQLASVDVPLKWWAYVELNGGANSYVIEGTAAYSDTLTSSAIVSNSSSASIVATISNSGLLTITNNVAYSGTIKFIGRSN